MRKSKLKTALSNYVKRGYHVGLFLPLTAQYSETLSEIKPSSLAADFNFIASKDKGLTFVKILTNDSNNSEYYKNLKEKHMLPDNCGFEEFIFLKNRKIKILKYE